MYVCGFRPDLHLSLHKRSNFIMSQKSFNGESIWPRRFLSRKRKDSRLDFIKRESTTEEFWRVTLEMGSEGAMGSAEKRD